MLALVARYHNTHVMNNYGGPPLDYVSCDNIRDQCLG